MLFGSPPGQSSWVTDFDRKPGMTPGEPSLLHTGEFTSDGTRLVVEGTKMHRVVMHLRLLKPFDLSTYLHDLLNEFLPAKAEMNNVSTSQLWRSWLKASLAKVTTTRHQPLFNSIDAGRLDTVQELLNVLSESDRQALSRFSPCEYCLLDDGTHFEARLHSSENSKNSVGSGTGLEAWALKGAACCFVLEKTDELLRYYKVVGYLVHSANLDAAFFATMEGVEDHASIANQRTILREAFVSRALSPRGRQVLWTERRT